MAAVIHQENMKIDYSIWSRKPQESSTIIKKDTSQMPVIGSACSSAFCRHNWNHKKSPPNDGIKLQAKNKRIKELKTTLESQKAILSDLNNKRECLLTANFDLLSSIEKIEGAQYDKINKSIEKYESRKDGIDNLQNCFIKQKETLMKEVDDLKRRIDAKIFILQRENNKVDHTLEELNEELTHLKNYKNNEYELRTLDIMALEQKIKELCLNFEEEYNDLENVIQSETNCLLKGDSSTTQHIKESIAQELLDSLPKSLICQAKQNEEMKEEIECQKKLKDTLEMEIKTLDQENSRLITLPSSHIRQTMFPHLYKNFQKCSPDEDFDLDIPRPVQLPF